MDQKDQKGHLGFWRQLHPLLMKYEPNCDPPHKSAAAAATVYDPNRPHPRPDVIEMTRANVAKMKIAHDAFVSEISSRRPRLHYNPGTRGLVSTVAGTYLPVLVISLRMLRRTGSRMSVEVFLADDQDYEAYICQIVLPSLNANCVVLSDILDAVADGVELEKYQFKAFAIVFSSFEEVLFLDADSFSLEDPVTLFDNEPFTSRKMITWPDFWASSASSLYYTIVSQPVPSSTLRQSTESGEMMISKRTHEDTLLLCAYYNYWGPDYFYPLLSQGAPGEGDKETFVAAAAALNKPFYQVSEKTVALGHSTKDGLAGSAMVQFDPVEDFALIQKGEWRINGSTAARPRPFFVHANFPKFNPATIFAKQEVNPVFKDDGKTYTRAWTLPEDVVRETGPDLERHFWEEIMWTACELETKFYTWRGKENICKDVKAYWNAMYATSRGDTRYRH
jgi:alpha 1,2-mannosyltransferase